MRKSYMKVLVAAALLLCAGCSSGDTTDESGNDYTDGSITGGSSAASGTGNDLVFTVGFDTADDVNYAEKQEVVPTDENADYYEDFVENFSTTSTVTITYDGTSAVYSELPSGVTVSVNGAGVTVNSTAKKVEYILKGTASEGFFKLYSDNKFKLTLTDVSLACSNQAAINIQSSKRGYVVINGANTLTSSCSATTEGEDMKGCIFSEGKLLFSGSGTLNVTEGTKHGIASDDYVYVHNGPAITVSAKKDGIHTNGQIIIGGGTLNVTSQSDGLECEKGFITINSGKITVNSADDAICATYEDSDASITPAIYVNGGLIKVNTTEAKGMGLKSTGAIQVTDGCIQAQVSGDGSKGLSCDGDMSLTGGKITVIATGNAVLEYDSSLSIVSDVSGAAGIKCDGTLSIDGATLAMKSSGEGGKGISCDGDIIINSGTVQIITTGSKYAYNSTLDSSPKGIKADGNLTINGGVIQVQATAGEGSEGIESKKVLTFNGGTTEVYTYDDALNAKSNITVNGGNIYAYATNNDAIDSNGTLTVNGGVIVASGASSPEAGMDCDQNTFSITGGILISVGGSTSTPTNSACKQYAGVFGGSGNAGALFSVVASDGSHVLSYYLPNSLNQMTVLFSSSAMKGNTSYSIYSGGSVSGGTTFHRLTYGGTFNSSSALQANVFTTSNYVTSIGSSGVGGNHGGGMPGGGWH